jgi:hypothetical protein
LPIIRFVKCLESSFFFTSFSFSFLSLFSVLRIFWKLFLPYCLFFFLPLCFLNFWFFVLVCPLILSAVSVKFALYLQSKRHSLKAICLETLPTAMYFHTYRNVGKFKIIMDFEPTASVFRLFAWIQIYLKKDMKILFRHLMVHLKRIKQFNFFFFLTAYKMSWLVSFFSPCNTWTVNSKKIEGNIWYKLT